MGNATTKLLFEVFLLALWLQSLRTWFVFILDLSSYLSSSCWFGLILVIYIFVFCPLQNSLIAMASCWIFWSKWMWSDPNLSMLLPQLYLSKSYAFYWKLSIVFIEPCQLKLIWQTFMSVFKCAIFITGSSRNSERPPRQSRRAWEHGTTTQELHACHVSFKCELPGAPA